MSLYDERGRTIELADAGRRGGEGSVHRIHGDATHVAKIYHPGRLTSDLHTKLRVMLEQPPNEAFSRGRPPNPPSAAQHRSIAWVDGLVFGDRAASDLRGFTMPFVDTDEFRQAHVYYDVSDRTRLFGGDFTWRHLMFAAHNLASAVSAVHAAGHRVGDLRETNLLVAPSALVTLIDCDSFQIRDRRSQHVYPTRVATGDYLPPELHGIDFGTQHPDRYHADLFALAVLVFRFLMLGVHPFQAKGPGVADAPTTEAKIRRGVFAFAGGGGVRGISPRAIGAARGVSPRARTKGAEPPEYAPPWSVLPASVQRLFVRAFVDGHSSPDVRPAANDWVTALADEGKRVRTCNANPNHLYAHASRSCPWCRSATDPFPGPLVAGRQVALAAPPTQIPEAARVEQVRAYTRVALSDGAITEHEFTYLRKAGGELGLKTAVIDRVIDDESRRSGVSYLKTPASPSSSPAATPSSSPAPSTPSVVHANGSVPVSAWSALRATVAHPAHVVRDRRLRSVAKAALPVLVVCGVAGVLAPVSAPVAAAVVGLPALAVAGEVRSARRWRTYAKVPWRIAVHVHHALGHAARIFVPLAAVGAATVLLRDVPGPRPDVTARVLSAIALVTLAWFVMARLPFGSDTLAAPLRAGRDLVWGVMVGGSGRARRPAYAVWVVALAGVALVVADAVLGTSHTMWWPLGSSP